jgi:hypothetical protein
MHRSSFALHSLGDFAESFCRSITVRGLDREVSDREHAYQLSFFAYGQAADLFIRHETGSFFYINVGLNGLKFVSEDLFDIGFSRVLAISHTADNDIAICDNADKVVILVNHWDSADILDLHDRRCFL